MTCIAALMLVAREPGWASIRGLVAAVAAIDIATRESERSIDGGTAAQDRGGFDHPRSKRRLIIPQTRPPKA